MMCKIRCNVLTFLNIFLALTFVALLHRKLRYGAHIRLDIWHYLKKMEMRLLTFLEIEF